MQHREETYTMSQKKICQCYFFNNSVKHWQILIIFWHATPWRNLM